jgi:hypothetical protein
LFAAVGAAGVGAFTGGSGLARSFTSAPPSYTHYTYAASDTDGPQLRVAWYSTYNGAVISRTPGDETGQNDADTPEYTESYDIDTHGPLVAEENLLPGDSGGISVGLLAEEMDARIQLLVTGDEPGTTVSGRLGEVIDVTMWSDTGIFGIGGCTGSLEPPDNGTTTMSLAEFSRQYGPDGGDQLLLRDCLPEGERFCLGFAWHIDESVTSDFTSESTAFGLSFQAEQCRGSLL